jgi:hypothetical protein
MKEINFQSETHLGDCIMHTDFLNKLIKIEDVNINFYIVEKHRKQVEEFIENKNRIKPFNLSEAPSNAQRAWLNLYGHIQYIPFDCGKLKLDFFQTLSRNLNIKCPYNNIIDLLPDSPLICENPNDSEWDILLINSDGLSNQTKNIPLNCDKFIEKFKHKKIITTKKIKDIPCTLDLNYSVLDIAKLSLKCKIIVGVHTAPWHLVMNKINYDLDKKMYMIDNNSFYTYKNCTSINNLDCFI